MTVERHIELQDRLREILGDRPAATLWSMLPGRDDVATKKDLSAVRDDLKSEIGELRGDVGELRDHVRELRGDVGELRDHVRELRGDVGELRGDVGELRSEMGALETDVGLIRQEMDLKFATKDDLLDLRRDFTSSVQGMVRTFVAVQAATVVGISGILYGFLRLT